MPLPMVNSGASVPPEVPLPRETAQEINFMMARNATTLSGPAVLEIMPLMLL